MKNTVYRYTVSGCYATEYRSIIDSRKKEKGLWIETDQYFDNILGGRAKAIKENTLELIYEIWGEVEDDKLNHPSITSYEKVEIEVDPKVTKLPPGEPRNVNWKSANRGGGVRHKNFDKQATKNCYFMLVMSSLGCK